MKVKIIALLSLLFVSNAFAADSVDHSEAGSKHSVLASVEGASTAVSVASAVAVVPVIAGTIATVVVLDSVDTVIQDSHSQHTTAPTPLEITNVVITRDPPPSEAIKN